VKLLPLKYLTVFIILLFSLEISKGQLNHSNKESGEITLSQCSKNKSPEKNCLNLELRENQSRPTNHGEKVVTIVIACPLSKYSEVRLISLFTLQKIVFSKGILRYSRWFSSINSSTFLHLSILTWFIG
jgi:hypothetical protein